MFGGLSMKDSSSSTAAGAQSTTSSKENFVAVEDVNATASATTASVTSGFSFLCGGGDNAPAAAGGGTSSNEQEASGTTNIHGMNGSSTTTNDNDDTVFNSKKQEEGQPFSLSSGFSFISSTPAPTESMAVTAAAASVPPEEENDKNQLPENGDIGDGATNAAAAVSTTTVDSSPFASSGFGFLATSTAATAPSPATMGAGTAPATRHMSTSSSTFGGLAAKPENDPNNQDNMSEVSDISEFTSSAHLQQHSSTTSIMMNSTNTMSPMMESPNMSTNNMSSSFNHSSTSFPTSLKLPTANHSMTMSTGVAAAAATSGIKFDGSTIPKKTTITKKRRAKKVGVGAGAPLPPPAGAETSSAPTPAVVPHHQESLSSQLPPKHPNMPHHSNHASDPQDVGGKEHLGSQDEDQPRHHYSTSSSSRALEAPSPMRGKYMDKREDHDNMTTNEKQEDNDQEVDATIKAAELAAKEAREMMNNTSNSNLNQGNNNNGGGGFISNLFGRNKFRTKSPSPQSVPRIKITSVSADSSTKESEPTTTSATSWQTIQTNGGGGVAGAAAVKGTKQSRDLPPPLPGFSSRMNKSDDVPVHVDDEPYPPLESPTIQITRQNGASTKSDVDTSAPSGHDYSIAGRTTNQHSYGDGTGGSWQPPALTIPSYGPSKLADNKDVGGDGQINDEEEEQERSRRAAFKEQERLYAEEQKSRREQEERLKLEEQERLAKQNRSPEQKICDMLKEFHFKTSEELTSLKQWRTQKNALKEELIEAQRTLAHTIQQIRLMEDQQSMAAQKEDFDLADQLTTILNQREKERSESERMLREVEGALDQMEQQRQCTIKSIVSCFSNIRGTLDEYRQELSSSSKVDDTESMKLFETRSKKISAEQDRLTIEEEHLTRDEELVSTERQELEATIHEETKDTEDERLKTIEEQERVMKEIEELEAKLAAKKKEAANLEANITKLDGDIMKVRNKFSRQLTRVSKKETALKENRHEWETDKKSLEKLRDVHETEMQSRANEMLRLDRLVEFIQEEISVAEKMECVVEDEMKLGIGSSTANTTNKDDDQTNNNNNDSGDDDANKLLEHVSKCQAAVEEAKLEVNSAIAALDALEAETKKIEIDVPNLEQAKQEAVAQRDFKSAGRASKSIKELLARKQVCEDEINGVATNRVTTSTAILTERTKELNDAQEAHETMKTKLAKRSMQQLAEQIRMLQQLQNGVCSATATEEKDEKEDDDDSSVSLKKITTTCRVAFVGASVLQDEIDALMLEGEELGRTFGGWSTILKELESTGGVVSSCSASVSMEGETNDDKKKEDLRSDNSHKEDEIADAEDDTSNKNQDDEKRENKVIASQDIELYFKLEQQLEELEPQLEQAVEDEDYELCEELNGTIEEMKEKLIALGWSKEEILQAQQDLLGKEDEDKEEEGVDAKRSNDDDDAAANDDDDNDKSQDDSVKSTTKSSGSSIVASCTGATASASLDDEEEEGEEQASTTKDTNGDAVAVSVEEEP